VVIEYADQSGRSVEYGLEFDQGQNFGHVPDVQRVPFFSNLEQ
jgi:hypothetical protein